MSFISTPSPGRASLPAPEATRMFAEAAEAPRVVARQLAENAGVIADLATQLRASPPRAVFTLGRGSSDNAATFARYLIDTRLGAVTASASPSVSSIYGAASDMQGVLVLAISQSGRSPDLVAAAQSAAAEGALVVALVNDAASPLADTAQVVIPLRAGPEFSVAATKTFITSLSAIAQLTAHWTNDATLMEALGGLPDLLARAWELDWSDAVSRLVATRNLYAIGRGVGFAIAQEAALKFKETCRLHAEAFSAAELLHGPMALVEPGFPVLAFAQDDESRQGVEEVADACAAKGAAVIEVGGRRRDGVCSLPALAAHAALEPVAFALSFYKMINALALARGFNPDRPPNLAKVTETI